MTAFLGGNPLSYEGVKARHPADVIDGARDPLPVDIGYDIGTIWINKSSNSSWMLTSVVAGVASWVTQGPGILTITGDSGGAKSPDGAGNFSLLGTAGEITVTGGANKQTLSIPDSFSFGGSGGASTGQILVGTGGLTVDGAGGTSYNIGSSTTTGTITIGGTGAHTGTCGIAPGTGAQTINIGTGTGGKTVHIADGAGANAVTLGSTNTTSATTVQSGSGNITLTANGGVLQTTAPTTVTLGANASTGLAVSTAAGTGVTATFTSSAATKDAIEVPVGGIKVSSTAVSGASPQTMNARFGRVSFTGVNIASGASQAFVINNSMVLAAATQVLVTMHGATAGSALSMQSIVTAANSITITVTNGTSATMVTSVADITFVFWVLN